MVTKRMDVNRHMSDCVTEFVAVSNAVVSGARVLGSVNYDLREMTTIESVAALSQTLEAAQSVKKNWQLVKGCVNDINTNVDWYIARVKADLLRYRKKFYDEQEGRFPRQPENN